LKSNNKKKGYDPVLVLNKASERVPNRPELSRPSYKSSFGGGLQDEEGEEEEEADEEKVEQITWIARREQELIDQIIHGQLAGQYWLITGTTSLTPFNPRLLLQASLTILRVVVFFRP
jgi:hypothetical protein